MRIQDNKCTWLVTQALDRSSDKIRDEISKFYGQNKTESVERIKELYSEVLIPELFEKFEEESFDRIEHLIGEYNGPLDPDLFHQLKYKLYKRSL